MKMSNVCLSRHSQGWEVLRIVMYAMSIKFELEQASHAIRKPGRIKD